MEYGTRIAERALEIEAIKLWPKHKPFLWACKSYMPIYNDNRMFLGAHRDRMLIASSLVNMISQSELPDIVGGTSTSGIAPATSVAQMLGRPLAIQHNGEAYLFTPKVMGELCLEDEEYSGEDIVVSTSPFAIPSAVLTANRMNLPFAYVRTKKKGHGLLKQIEGMTFSGQSALLIDYHMGESYVDVAKQALEEEGLDISLTVSQDISDLVVPASVKGTRIAQVEDLISTGGSCIKEIEAYRQMGATVDDCFAIFSYQLDKSAELFAMAEVNVHPALVYAVLIEQALKAGYVPGDSKAALDEWRQDIFNWGEKHGFPPEKKD